MLDGLGHEIGVFGPAAGAAMEFWHKKA